MTAVEMAVGQVKQAVPASVVAVVAPAVTPAMAAMVAPTSPIPPQALVELAVVEIEALALVEAVAASAS